MILQCPSCFAKYFIDENFMKSSKHKNVKCTKCHYQWSLDKQKKNENIIANNNKKKVAKYDKKAINIDMKNINYAFVLNFLFVFLLISTSIIIFHDDLPVKIRAEIYNSLPFKLANIIDTHGMLFENLKIENNEYNSQNNVNIKGFIVNNSNKIKIVPPIRICLGNESKKCMRSYYIKSNGKAIGSRSKEHFHYKIVNVESEIDRIVIDMGNKIELMLR